MQRKFVLAALILVSLLATALIPAISPVAAQIPQSLTSSQPTPANPAHPAGTGNRQACAHQPWGAGSYHYLARHALAGSTANR